MLCDVYRRASGFGRLEEQSDHWYVPVRAVCRDAWSRAAAGPAGPAVSSSGGAEPCTALRATASSESIAALGLGPARSRDTVFNACFLNMDSVACNGLQKSGDLKSTARLRVVRSNFADEPFPVVRRAGDRKC